METDFHPAFEPRAGVEPAGLCKLSIRWTRSAASRGPFNGISVCLRKGEILNFKTRIPVYPRQRIPGALAQETRHRFSAHFWQTDKSVVLPNGRQSVMSSRWAAPILTPRRKLCQPTIRVLKSSRGVRQEQWRRAGIFAVCKCTCTEEC